MFDVDTTSDVASTMSFASAVADSNLAPFALVGLGIAALLVGFVKTGALILRAVDDRLLRIIIGALVLGLVLLELAWIPQAMFRTVVLVRTALASVSLILF